MLNQPYLGHPSQYNRLHRFHLTSTILGLRRLGCFCYWSHVHYWRYFIQLSYMDDVTARTQRIAQLHRACKYEEQDSNVQWLGHVGGCSVRCIEYNRIELWSCQLSVMLGVVVL